jgi:hypothetical protein
MRLSDMKNDWNKIRPDRLAAAFLIIGLLTACSFAFFGFIYFIVGGWPPASHVLPFILLGAVSIMYGSVRTVRGNSATKQSVKAALVKLRNGAIAGSTIAFIAIQIAQNAGNQGSWHNFVYGLVSHLIIAIPGALFFGISAGGIGGLILGYVLRSNKAAFIGGFIGGATTSILYLLNYFRGF